MCARFNLRTEPTELAEIFQLLREPDWHPRYNIAPTQTVLVIRQQSDGTRLADSLRWGLIPPWADDPAIGSKMINCRSESAATKPSFKAAFRERRCIIPASGFYEWQAITRQIKQPWHIYRPTGEPLLFAGLWETWKDPEGEAIETCTILTTHANHFMGELHERMPVILSAKDIDKWLDPEILDPEKLQPHLVPCPDNWLMRTPVAPLINSPRNDSPDCIRPVKLSRGLFD